MEQGSLVFGGNINPACQNLGSYSRRRGESLNVHRENYEHLEFLHVLVMMLHRKCAPKLGLLTSPLPPSWLSRFFRLKSCETFGTKQKILACGHYDLIISSICFGMNWDGSNTLRKDWDFLIQGQIQIFLLSLVRMNERAWVLSSKLWSPHLGAIHGFTPFSIPRFYPCSKIQPVLIFDRPIWMWKFISQRAYVPSIKISHLRETNPMTTTEHAELTEPVCFRSKKSS